MNTTEIGRLGEKIAACFLKKNRYRILAKNKHQSHNEIDIIAINKEYILFVEVKTRSVDSTMYSAYGTAASAVDRSKQTRTVRAAQDYLATHPLHNRQPRMDVVEVYLEKSTGKLLKINHIPNAFGAR